MVTSEKCYALIARQLTTVWPEGSVIKI